MTVSVGFTTQVYDRGAAGVLLPPKHLAQVGVDFLGLPLTELKLFEIASAYEQAAKNRRPPAAFPPLG